MIEPEKIISPWPGCLTVMETVSSTNDVIKMLAAKGAPEGTCVVAEQQTAGRGRMGRQFSSPKGMGIYLSILLRPGVSPDRLLHFTAAAAVAVSIAIEKETGLSVGIKWVNDLLLDNQKLAGLLTELSVVNGVVDSLILGIGINCGQRAFPPELQGLATSFAMHGLTVDRNRLISAILSQIHTLRAAMLQTGWMAEYEKRCVTIGARIQVKKPEGLRKGRAVKISENASLLVAYDNGETEWIRSGEVSVRGLYGYVT